jgi:hypothetical protein
MSSYSIGPADSSISFMPVRSRAARNRRAGAGVAGPLATLSALIVERAIGIFINDFRSW